MNIKGGLSGSPFFIYNLFFISMIYGKGELNMATASKTTKSTPKSTSTTSTTSTPKSTTSATSNSALKKQINALEEEVNSLKSELTAMRSNQASTDATQDHATAELAKKLHSFLTNVYLHQTNGEELLGKYGLI